MATLNAQTLADKISESLPVQLTAIDVEQNTEFVKLLKALSHNLAPDGTTLAIQNDVKEAQGNLKHEKLHWLQSHVLHTELEELLLDQQLAGLQATPSGSAQFYKAVQDVLTLAEIGDYLHCSPDPDCQVTLLGLSLDDIDRANPHKRHLQSIQQKLIPEMESRLRKKCESLVSFHEHSTAGVAGDNSGLVFAKASQLPEILEAEKQSVADQRRQLTRDRTNRDRQFWSYYQTLVDSLSVLETLITRHRLKSQSQSDGVTSEWLVARCDAMCLKVKFLELQVLCDTYYADTVQALTTIRRHVDGSIRDSEREVGRASEALKAFEAVGMGFDNLVQEYTMLRDEIDNKKWALRELKKHDIEDLT